MRQTKEMKAASEHLRRISHVDALVERYTELAREQRAIIDGVKSPVLSNGKTSGGASDPDKLGSAIAKLSELEEKLNGYIEELVELKADALQKIQMMDSIQERNLLTGRYLQGKTVDRLIIEFDKDRKWIYNHLNSALENFFNNFLKNETKGNKNP